MMETGHDYRQLIVKLIDANPRTAKPKVRIQESWETLVLGLASTAIGFAALTVVILGMRHREVSGLIDKRPVAWDRYGAATLYSYAPTWQSALATVAGECLGVVGIMLGRWRRQATSILCVLGTAVCLLHMILFYVHLRYFI
jgi:hypothetical protein